MTARRARVCCYTDLARQQTEFFFGMKAEKGNCTGESVIGK